MAKVVALILGGGQGKRLFPLTSYRSKPAVPIAAKYRLIDIPISNCLHSNIKDIYVLTQFNSESLNNHINNTYRFDYFSRAFVRILAAEQTVDNTNWFQGTADAVRRNIVHLNLKGDEIVLVLSGDHLYNMNYKGLIDFHISQGADFTVSTIPINPGEASEFGIMRLNSKNRITEFKEKPKKRSEMYGYIFTDKPGGKNIKQKSYCLASMGVYVFNAGCLLKVLEGDDADFGKEVIPNSLKKYNTRAYIFDGYWKDVGTIKAFYEVNMDLAAGKSYMSFFYDGLVFTRPRFLPAPRFKSCKVSSAIIAEGSALSNADIENSIIGLRSIVGNGCKISRSVIMGADYYEDVLEGGLTNIGIGDGTIIDKAIIDKNARIGKHVIIRNIDKRVNFDGSNYYIRDGIVIIPKNAVIKDGSKI